jgi:hypothetical protein
MPPPDDCPAIADCRAARIRLSERWWLVALVVGLVIWGFTDVRRRAVIDPDNQYVHRTDLTVFTAAGAAFFTDQDPYSLENPRGWKYPYPPLFALAMAPLSFLPSTWQAVAWFLFSVALAYGSWHECVLVSRSLGYDVRITRLNASPARWIGMAAIVAVSLPALNCLQRGQVGILKLYFLLLGFRLMLEARGWFRAFLGAAVFSLPTAVKVTPILPLCLVTFMFALSKGLERPRPPSVRRAAAYPLGACFGLVLFLFLLPAALIGWNKNIEHLQTWYERVATMAVHVDPRGQVDSPYTPRNQSLANATHRLVNWTTYLTQRGPNDPLLHRDLPLLITPVDEAGVELLLNCLKLLTVVLALAVSIVVGIRGDRLGQAAAFGIATAATLIVSPVSRGHYFVLLLPALLWVPCWLKRHGFPRMCGLSSAVVPVLSWLHYVALGWAGQVGLLGLGTTCWFLLATAWMLVGSLRQPAEQAGEIPQVYSFPTLPSSMAA